MNQCFTYCDLKTDGFVTDLPVYHGGLQERAEEEELLHLACGGLETQRGQHRSPSTQRRDNPYLVRKILH